MAKSSKSAGKPGESSGNGTSGDAARHRTTFCPLRADERDVKSKTPEVLLLEQQARSVALRMVEEQSKHFIRLRAKRLRFGRLAAAMKADEHLRRKDGREPSWTDVAIALGLCDERAPSDVKRQAGQEVRNAAKDARKRYGCASDHANCSDPCSLVRGRRLWAAINKRSRDVVSPSELDMAASTLERLR